jgi:hypothetical protein
MQENQPVKSLISTLLLIPCLALAGPGDPLTTLELRYRTAEDLIPTLKPLLGPEDAISGQGGLLFLRTDQATVQQIQGLLDQIDRRPANLMISVRTGTDMQREKQAIGISGDIRLDDPQQSEIRGTATSRYQTRDRGNLQQLRVLEGRTAYIDYGQSVPYPTISAGAGPYGHYQHYGMQYRDLHRGFVVRPRLSGDQVFLDINPRDERLSQQGAGMIDSSGLQTTINGQLGQWIRLGGTSETMSENNSGILSTGRKRSDLDNEIWVRVERLD